MCSPIRCRTCGKTTWSGCGQHIEEVRAQVPADQWCPGHSQTAGAEAGPSGSNSAGSAGKGPLRRLLGR